MLQINEQWRVPASEFRFTYARSSGPGGQNVNKVNSKVTLHWPATTTPSLPADVRERFCRQYHTRLTREGELVLQSQRYRDQQRNIDDCLEKLRDMLLRVAQRPKYRKATKPTRASQRRRLEGKRVRSETKSRRRGGSSLEPP